MNELEIKVKILPHFEGLPLPDYMTSGASGFDLLAACSETLVLAQGRRLLVPTGISLSLPPHTEAQVRPRSGLALKHGLTLVNSPGTIDSDYRGVVSLPLINLGKEPFVIKRGMRLAQLVLQEVVRADVECVDSLEETVRARGGFGHTGV